MPPRDKIASHFLVLVSLIFTNLDFGNAAGVTKYNQSIPFIVDSLEYFPDGVPPLVPPGYNCTSTPEPPPLNSVFMAAQYFQQEQLGNLTVGAAPWDPAHPGDQANSSCILVSYALFPTVFTPLVRCPFESIKYRHFFTLYPRDKNNSSPTPFLSSPA